MRPRKDINVLSVTGAMQGLGQIAGSLFKCLPGTAWLIVGSGHRPGDYHSLPAARTSVYRCSLGRRVEGREYRS